MTALAVVALVDLLYLSYAAALGRLLPAGLAPGAVGLALFGGVNAACLVRPALGERLTAASRAVLRRVDRMLSRAGLAAAFTALTILALALRLRVLARQPIDAADADMLPLLQQAMARLLAGHDPYVWYHLPYAAPMTYLPALWLPMVPAFALGLDVRLVQVLAAGAVGAVIVWSRWRGDAGAAPPAVRLALAAAFLLAPATVAFAAIGHTALYWLYLTLLLSALAARRWLPAGVACGLCAMARQTMWPALPIVVLHVARTAGRRERARFAAGAGIVVAALAPFFVSDPVFVLWGSVRWYSGFGPVAWAERPWWILNNPGFASLLYPLGLPHLLPLVGAAGLVLALAYAWARARDAGGLARALALALLATTLAAPTPWRYEFIPVVLVVMAGALAAPGPAGSPA